MHNFLTSQPDLNFHNAEVQEAILETVRFWLRLGVDGFRLDTANLYLHDAELRDNPARGDPSALASGDPANNPNNPYAWQVHTYQKNRPENVEFMRRLRRLMNEYPGTALVGEIGDGLAGMAQYTSGGDVLHMAYNFDQLGTRRSAPELHAMLSDFLHHMRDGWACWAISNHDVPRVASRWADGGDTGADQAAITRLAAALQVSLCGTPCIYQGDELGLTEAVLRREELKDPFGIEMWPAYKGRDGCRTPMPWSAQAMHAGFSTGATTWLPVPAEHLSLAVDRQTGDPGSMLGYYRRLLAWRKGRTALIDGNLALLPVQEQVIAYVRASAGERVLCAFNFSGRPARAALPREWCGVPVDAGSGLGGGRIVDGEMVFDAWGGLFAVAA